MIFVFIYIYFAWMSIRIVKLWLQVYETKGKVSSYQRSFSSGTIFYLDGNLFIIF